MEHRSVRFSTKKPVEHEAADLLGDWDQDEFQKILRLPLTKIINDAYYDRLDVHTAASLGISGKDVPEVRVLWAV